MIGIASLRSSYALLRRAPPARYHPHMITLYSYPPLFGVADNNGYGLKVFAFMRLAGPAFKHKQIFRPGGSADAPPLTSTTTPVRSDPG